MRSNMQQMLMGLKQVTEASGCIIGFESSVSIEETEEAEKLIGFALPPELVDLYSFSNGIRGNLIFGMSMLSLGEAVDIGNSFARDIKDSPTEDNYNPAIYTSDPEEKIKPYYWLPQWIALAEDHTDYLAIDLNPDTHGRSGQIIACGRNEQHCVVFDSLSEIFECLLSMIEERHVSLNTNELVFPEEINSIALAKTMKARSMQM